MPTVAFCHNRRLSVAADYSAVFSNADVKVSHATLLILAKVGDSGARLGLVVAKKNIRLAVNRNRFKRVVREVFRHQQVTLGDLDVVVLARKGFDQLNPIQQSQLINQCFAKLQRKLTQSKL